MYINFGLQRQLVATASRYAQCKTDIWPHTLFTAFSQPALCDCDGIRKRDKIVVRVYDAFKGGIVGYCRALLHASYVDRSF